jgi:hypothetical protein
MLCIGKCQIEIQFCGGFPSAEGLNSEVIGDSFRYINFSVRNLFIGIKYIFRTSHQGAGTTATKLLAEFFFPDKSLDAVTAVDFDAAEF